MKTRKHLLLWTLLAMWLSPVDSLASVTYSASYNPLKLHVGSDTLGGGTYAVLTYDGMEVTHEAGMPTLPCKYIRLSVPFKASNFSVQASATNPIYRNLTYKVYPAQEDHIMRPDTVYPATLPDSATYSATAYYPSVRAEIISESFVEGENHVVTVAITPIAYSPAANKLALYRNISLTVNYDTVYSQGLMPVIRDNDTLREIGRTKAASLVVNPAQVAPFAPSASDQAMLAQHYEGAEGNGMHSPHVILPDSLAYDSAQLQSIYTVPRCEYMIIAPNNLVSAAERIAALKRQKGYDVDIVPFPYVLLHPIAKLGDRIYSGDSLISTIADSAGILREYLRIAYRQGTKYVLLVGNQIPFRYGHDSMTESVPSDLYFSNLSMNWYCGATNPYGYIPGYTASTFDSSPHLSVGRVPCRNSEELDNYINKLYQYELNPGSGDLSYLNTILYTFGIEFTTYAFETRQTLSSVFSDSIMIVEGTGNGYPMTADVINTVNDRKPSFWVTNNHGEPSYIQIYGVRKGNHPYHFLWSTSDLHDHCRDGNPPFEEDSLNSLDKMSNKRYPMLLYSMACSTMPFDKMTPFDSVNTNIGESFVLGKGYGGPAYLGNTRVGYFGGSSQLENEFSSQIHSGNYKLGDAEGWSKYYFQKRMLHKHVIMTHNLLGDPELEVWTGTPTTYAGISISRTDNMVFVNNLNDSCIVAYCDNKGHQYKEWANGSTSKSVSPNSSVMVYRHNALPLIMPLMLQNETITKSRYVIASTVEAGNSIDDNRTSGDVRIASGADYRIEATGDVKLHGGFSVERGASFSVTPSDY